MAPHNRITKVGGMTEIRPGIARRVRAHFSFIVPIHNAGRCIDRKLADPSRPAPHAPSLGCGAVDS
jgi:hypothetical protein